jgi:hypothetical protein
MTLNTSRRRFLVATGAVGAAAGLNVAVLAQDDDQKFILLGGHTQGWLPYRLAGDDSAEEAEDNPTLTLVPDTTYTLLWRNVDGQPHNFAIHDADGESLQVLQPLDVGEDAFEQINETAENETIDPENVTVDNETAANVTTVPEEDLIDLTETVGEEGAVQGVRFTATEEMAEYICEVHPNTMVGDIELADGEDGGNEENDSSG